MKTVLRTLVLASTLVAGSALCARTVSLPLKNAPLRFEIPDSWESANIKRGLEIKSNDGEVFLWVEAYSDADFGKIKAEHSKYFESQGVKVTGEPKIATQSAERYGLAFMDMPATWNGKPTVLRYILVEPTDASKRRMMISYWASPEGDKTHGDAMSALIESLSQAVDAMR